MRSLKEAARVQKSLLSCGACGADVEAKASILTCGDCKMTSWCNDKCKDEHTKDGGHAPICHAFATQVSEHDHIAIASSSCLASLLIRPLQSAQARVHTDMQDRTAAAAAAGKCILCHRKPQGPVKDLPCKHVACEGCLRGLSTACDGNLEAHKVCSLCRPHLGPCAQTLFELGLQVWLLVLTPGAPCAPGDIDDAMTLLQAATDQGHPQASGMIGTIFYFGQAGVTPE